MIVGGMANFSPTGRFCGEKSGFDGMCFDLLCRRNYATLRQLTMKSKSTLAVPSIHVRF